MDDAPRLVHSSVVPKASRITAEARKLVSQGLDRETAITMALSKVPASSADKAFAMALWARTYT